MKRVRGVLLALLGAAAVSLPTAEAQQSHSLHVVLRSAEDGQPLNGASVWLITEAQTRATTRSAAGLSRLDAKTLDPAGSAEFFIPNGVYFLVVKHDAFRPKTFRIDVPPPGVDDFDLEFSAALKLKNKVLARPLTVRVRGETLPASVPLAYARVTAYNEEEEAIGSGVTDYDGVLEMGTSAQTRDPDGPLIQGRGSDPKMTVFNIGELVRIEAQADGYLTSSRTVLIGSAQDDNVEPNFSHRTSTSDEVELFLKRDPGGPVTTSSAVPRTDPGPVARLSVDVLRSDNSNPIPDALVEVEAIGGATVASGRTDSQGHTLEFEFPYRNPGNLHAAYRVRVRATNYTSTFEDLPDELLLRSATGRYTTFLVEAGGGTKPGWTLGEEAALRRFVSWAKARPPRVTSGQEELSDLGDQVSVTWDDQKTAPGGPYQGRVNVRFFPQRPGQVSFGDFRLQDGDEEVSIGGYQGVVNVRSRQVNWRQGSFLVYFTYQAADPNLPRRDGLMDMANQVSGAIGDPGK